MEESEEFSTNKKDDSDEGKSKKSKKKNKNKIKINQKDIKKLTKNIINSFKDRGLYLFYISKFDLQRLNDDEKIALYSKNLNYLLNQLLKMVMVKSKKKYIIKISFP